MKVIIIFDYYLVDTLAGGLLIPNRKLSIQYSYFYYKMTNKIYNIEIYFLNNVNMMKGLGWVNELGRWIY